VSIELIFVRHGKTLGNDHGKLHGRTDTPLAPEGEVQARQVARRLAELGEIDLIYTSPLQRARATATEIGSVLNLEPVIDDRLVEFDFGDFEGYSFEELQVHHPDYYLKMVEPSSTNDAFPNGESLADLHERVAASLDEIASNNAGDRLVIVAHLIVIATGMAHLTTGDPRDAIRYLVRNCSITRVEHPGKTPANVVSIDDVSHLG
jgi:broad specificity phosphatase PhoE